MEDELFFGTWFFYTSVTSYVINDTNKTNCDNFNLFLGIRLTIYLEINGEQNYKLPILTTNWN
jgi:hypothetical protein